MIGMIVVLALSAGISEFPPYAVARLPTPVFSDPGFTKNFGGDDGRTLKRDRCGQIRSLEFIAPAGSSFTIKGVVPGISPAIWQVTTNEYPYPATKGYFVDPRFLTPSSVLPPRRARSLPSKTELIRQLRLSAGAPYVWGGNVKNGVPELPRLYHPSSPLPAAATAAWSLAGLDCSGLLYEASGGVTPRNTSTLVNYGHTVPLEGLDASSLAALLRPLDLIVWNGHVMIVIDGGELVESRLKCGEPGNGGVVIRPLLQALTQLMKVRTPVNVYPAAQEEGKVAFVVRRWYPEQ
jgi:hypothetical protein